MKTKIHSQSGVFNPRILAAFALGSVGVLLAMLSFAANPPRGMKTPAGSSAGASAFVDNHAVLFNGSVAAAAASTPLAPTGPAWSIVTSPNTSTTHYNYLFDVTCTSASDCWAVGYYVIPGHGGKTLIEHWNGTAWSIVTSPNGSTTRDNSLSGVTCASVSNCWAVGYYYNGSNPQTLIEHWNGTAWSIVTSPNATQNDELSGVTCASASDCWAVGDYAIDSAGLPGQTLIEHWNGTAWSIVTSPNTSTGQDNRLFDVTCASASDCWVVGQHSFDRTLIEHWNGTAWSIVTSPNATQGNELSGVTCTSASDCWAVGDYNTGSVGGWRALIEHWNGTAWSIVTSPNTSGTQYYLRDVTCASASDCWAVGHSLTVPGGLSSISGRLGVEGGDNVLIGGFVISGTGAKQVLVRALGPTLSQFGVTGVLQNPVLELHNSAGAVILSNDNWGQAPNAQSIPPNFRPPNGLESAILINLNPGAYTAVVRGVNNTTGVGLVEIYDLSPTSSSHLTSISARGLVQVGDGVMIAGVAVQSGSKNVLVRALGPTLAGFGISNPLANPTLELHDANGALISSNDNWKSTQQAEIAATGKAPPNDLESAIMRTLAPGNYTAIVRGVNNTSGVALVEVYALNIPFNTLTEHWNGTAWSIVTSPNASQGNVISGATCTSASDCWAVGEYSNGSSYSQTLIERYSAAEAVTRQSGPAMK